MLSSDISWVTSTLHSLPPQRWSVWLYSCHFLISMFPCWNCCSMHFQVHHDMNAPLSHYFMFTGHNSYLTGNQLSSDSSIIPIIKALRNNVRVIELDLWPNSAKDNVEVRHGGYDPWSQPLSVLWFIVPNDCWWSLSWSAHWLLMWTWPNVCMPLGITPFMHLNTQSFWHSRTI